MSHEAMLRAPSAGSALLVERPYFRTDPAPYAGSAPCFYDVEAFEWTQRLRRSWRAIRAEFESVNRERDHVVDVFNPAGPKIAGWRSVNFQTYLWRYPRAWRAFPLTASLLESVPGLTSAFINVLEPHSFIPPHHGDSQTIVRFHLGLDVPEGDCGIRVGGQTRRCGDGKILAFCDAHEHSSWNDTDERRVVLIFDVMRPEYLARREAICANVLSATVVVWLETHLRRRQPLPPWARGLLRRVIGGGFRLALPLKRLLG